MIISDDWLFRNVDMYVCNGYCEECDDEECEERIEPERERDTKTHTKRID